MLWEWEDRIRFQTRRYHREVLDRVQHQMYSNRQDGPAAVAQSIKVSSVLSADNQNRQGLDNISVINVDGNQQTHKKHPSSVQSVETHLMVQTSNNDLLYQYDKNSFSEMINETK